MVDINDWIYNTLIHDNKFDTIILLATLTGAWVFKVLDVSNSKERGLNVVAGIIIAAVTFLILCTEGILTYISLIIMSIGFIYLVFKIVSGDWFK